MFLVSSSVTKTMAEDVKGFESCVQAKRIGSRFYIEQGTRTVNTHPFNCIDVMAVLPTEFGKSLIFQVRSSTFKKKNKNRLLEYHRDFSISKPHT